MYMDISFIYFSTCILIIFTVYICICLLKYIVTKIISSSSNRTIDAAHSIIAKFIIDCNCLIDGPLHKRYLILTKPSEEVDNFQRRYLFILVAPPWTIELSSVEKIVKWPISMN